MANYYGTARTSYWLPKSRQELERELEPLPVTVVEHGTEPGLVAILCDDEGGWPSYLIDEDTDEDVEIDIVDLIGRHLADDHVAVVMEVGAEKLRYLTGYAVAVNNRLERRQIHLDDIYDLARQLGPKVGHASY